MSKRNRRSSSGVMLDLWRPPRGAGEPIGCLTSTYTFAPALFDEQCLARFLEIESEPSREDLAFLLERESRLGGVYAGVLVDYTHAGVEHSLRWDVLPVRIRSAKQHAKLSLLAWSRHIRIIVASANLTEPGYRINREVAAAVDLTPEESNTEMLNGAVEFLQGLVALVPGASARTPAVERARAFLSQVTKQGTEWNSRPRKDRVRQHLVFTLPVGGADRPALSSLRGAVQVCRRRGGSPSEAWVASPFFDPDADTSRVAASLCKVMARGKQRDLCFCVPAATNDCEAAALRLAAPIALLRTPPAYHGSVTVKILPEFDKDKNRRPWHAKMLALLGEEYSALMVGSSNFTCAGMGVGQHRNAEANLLTVVQRMAYARETRQLETVWPEMEHVAHPECAEWLGAQADREEEEQAAALPLPAGFLSATYRAGDRRQIILRFDPDCLPEEWSVRACGQAEREMLSSASWFEGGQVPIVEVDWTPVEPPEKLLVRWAGHQAFLPLNIEDSRELPPPTILEHMSADDMLMILAATDPSAAFRAWAKRRQPSAMFDGDLDAATPVDLDPLRRYDLHATFLHRIRRRARVLAQLRSNLERPVWGQQALEWRLRGLVGIEPLADRLVRECSNADDEALLTLADFLIVLREVDYQPSDGSLSKVDFEKLYRPFLNELADKLCQQIELQRGHIAEDLMPFWRRVIEQCRK